MKGELLALEERKAALLEEMEELGQEPPRLHPGLARVYRRKVAELTAALNEDELRAKATETTRSLGAARLKWSTSRDDFVPFAGGRRMAGRRDKPEEIVTKLRRVEVLQGQGMAVAEAVRQIGVTRNTYYRWRKEYGGLSRAQFKRLKELESEASCAIGSSAVPNNQRLRKAVSDLTLDKLILTEAAKGSAPAAAKPYY